MKYRILTALGVLAAMTGIASSAHAQSPVAPSSEVGEVELSGEPYLGIERRTIQDDFDKFFLEEDTPDLALNTDPEPYNFFIPEENAWAVSENVNLLVNEPFAEPITAIPFPQPVERYDDIDRVEVRVDLLD